MTIEKQLISLDDFNKGKRVDYRPTYELNGIACPKCGKELYDNADHCVLASLPPQKRILCLMQGCDWHGTRIF